MMERGHESKVRLSRELNVFISELITLIVSPYEMQALPRRMLWGYLFSGLLILL